MSIKGTLNKIRENQYASSSIEQKVVQVLLALALGMLLGYIAKYSDTVSPNGLTGSTWNIVSDTTTRLGIWVFLATLVAAWSNNPTLAAIKVFALFVGMLLVYYLYSMLLFGFFPTYYFVRWGIIALASPMAAYVVWYGRGNGWLAASCAAAPIGLLASLGYPFFYTQAITRGFDILFAIVLLLILPLNSKQLWRTFIWELPIMLMLINSHLLSHILGGL